MIAHDASNIRSPRDQTTFGGFPAPPQLEAHYHTTTQVAPSSVPVEFSLSTETSCILQGLGPIAYLTRRLLQEIPEDMPSSLICAPPRWIGLERIMLTSQTLSNVRNLAKTLKGAVSTGRDASCLAGGWVLVALLAPVLRPLEFMDRCVLAREFFVFLSNIATS